jgi:hypothetical protein
MIKYLLVFTSLIATMFLAAPSAQIQTSDQEPIAFIGHGAFFDQDGKQIELTLELVARAQDWYGLVPNKIIVKFERGTKS